MGDATIDKRLRELSEQHERTLVDLKRHMTELIYELMQCDNAKKLRDISETDIEDMAGKVLGIRGFRRTLLQIDQSIRALAPPRV